MENYGRKNEVLVSNSDIVRIDLNMQEVLKSVCKIIYNKNIGSGFLIKLFINVKQIFCLMTNQHVITKEMIKSNAIIDVKYNFEKKWIKIKLDEKERFIKYNKKLDVTIVEILPNDYVKDKYFLIPNINNDNKVYIKKDIYIVQFPEGKYLSYSIGKITDMYDYELVHDASTKPGSSGSPIVLKGSTEVLGIHKQGNKKKNLNYGTFIHSFIKELNNNNIFSNTNNNILVNNNSKNNNFFVNSNNNIFVNNNIKSINTIPNNKKVYENGDYYIGEMLNNIPNGKGTKYDKYGNIIYEGEIINGKANGKGKFNYKNGYYYVGQWLNDKKNGKGKIYDRNGNVEYEGNFVNGKYEGYGKGICENGGYYIGQWFGGLKNGKGILYYKNGNVKYEGDFVNDKFQGYGKFIDKDGNYYIGYWMNNLKHGKGILFNKNGNIIYGGIFFNDMVQKK